MTYTTYIMLPSVRTVKLKCTTAPATTQSINITSVNQNKLTEYNPKVLLRVI